MQSWRPSLIKISKYLLSFVWLLLWKRNKCLWVLFISPLRLLPGLINQKPFSCAGEVLDVSSRFAVDVIPRGLADSQEVWPQTADGVLSNIGERLANSSSKHEAPDSFIDACHILGPLGLILDTWHVNIKAFTTCDLQQKRLNSQPTPGQHSFKWLQGKLFGFFSPALTFKSWLTTIRVKGIMTPPNSW